MKWGFSDQQQQLAVTTAQIASARATFALAKDLKPAYWRLMAAWNMIANTKDPAATNARNWSTIDVVINDILLISCDIVMIIGQGRPQWAGTGTPEDYGNFCAEVATRYKPGGVGIRTDGIYAPNTGKGVSRFEIWNEQNQANFWGAGAPNPAVYTEYLKSAYTKIKAVTGLSGTNSKVMFGGMQHIARNAYQDQWAWAGLPEVVFLQKCYDYATAQGFTLGSYFDVMCEHIYTQSDNVAYGGSVVGPAPSPSTDNLLQLVAIRALMVAQGDTAKNMWITEAGFSTATLTEALQSAYFQDLLTFLGGLSYVEAVLIYNAVDVDTNSTSFDSRLGVARTDLTKKPAWTWLQSFSPTTGSGGTPMSATATAVGMATTSCDLQVRVKAIVNLAQHMSAATAMGATTTAGLVNLTDDLGAASSVGVSTTGTVVVNGLAAATTVGLATTAGIQVLTLSGSTLVGIAT
jgi:hypothetical protein